MRKFLIFILLSPVAIALGQDSKIYDKVDIPAEPINGIEQYYQEIGNLLIYPKEEADKGIEGRVFIAIVIDTNGEVEKAEVLKGFNKACDEAALQAVKNAGKWKPGSIDGQAVKQKVILPVNFALNTEKKE